MDIEALGSAPDIETIDNATLNFGNELEAETPADNEPPAQEQLEAEVAEANGEKS